jgi:hypothetical protein
MDRFLIDECLSADLVATAKARGYDADRAGSGNLNRTISGVSA